MRQKKKNIWWAKVYVKLSRRAPDAKMQIRLILFYFVYTCVCFALRWSCNHSLPTFLSTIHHQEQVIIPLSLNLWNVMFCKISISGPLIPPS